MKSPARRALFLPLLGLLAALPLGAAGVQKPSPPENRVRLLRSWEEAVKLGDKSENQHVDLVFDYTEGVARILSYDASGQLVSSRSYSENLPQPSKDEIAEAIGIIRADAELTTIFERTHAIPEGGFLLEEAPGGACGPKTRCVQIHWLSEGRFGLIRRVVVDLMKGAIVYRSYIPQHAEVAK